ncbi:MAG: hypothetical protein IIV45_06730 [Lachnospiraceae bacterium]|nr:hypothetical protein [Lachnospiraceae bacterium]
MAESYEKQKRFITDASHEIKTPLTIIDANTEIIEMTMGEMTGPSVPKSRLKGLLTLRKNLFFCQEWTKKIPVLKWKNFLFPRLYWIRFILFQVWQKQRERH